MAALLAFGACTPDAGDAPSGSPDTRPSVETGPTAGSPGSGPLSLLYLDGRSIRAHDVRGGSDRLLLRLPSPDAYAAPRGRWIAVVRDARPPAPGEEDFAARPRLSLVDPSSGRRIDLGAGLSPLWDPGGTSLAWLKPVGERSCSAEACLGDVRVRTLELPGMRRRVVTPAGRWGLLAWAGDHLLLSHAADPAGVVLASPHGRARLGLPPSEVWGTSPSGGLLLRSVTSGLELVELEPTRAALGSVRSLRGPGRALAEGSWSPQGDELAAVEIVATASGIPSSRVVLLSPGSTRLEPLPGSRGATGPVLWSPRGDALAFARPAGRSGGRLEAVVCRLRPARSCRPLFSWREGVLLLRLQHGLG